MVHLEALFIALMSIPKPSEKFIETKMGNAFITGMNKKVTLMHKERQMKIVVICWSFR